MKNIYFRFFLIGLVGLILSGCMVKKTLKKGEAYEKAGMFKDAAELYYNASLKKPTSPELKIALKRAGQLYVDEQAEKIAEASGNGDYKETVYAWLRTREFIDRTGRQGIDLRPDPGMNRYYEEAKERYLSQRYEAGQRLIGEQKFDEAREIFAEINKIDPEYRDTKSYLKQATYEPVYQEGARLFGEGKYMEAYARWQSIFVKDRNYNDVAGKMQEALNERYKQGSVSLMNENFREAAVALGEVFRADPSFKDVRQLFTEARNEPVYRDGISFLSTGKCRSAYYAFDQVLKDAGTYKDSDKQRETALACAQYPVAVATAPKKWQNASIKQFQAVLTGALINQKNIFLKIYDLAAIDQGAIAAMVSQSGSFNNEFLRFLGNNRNLKAVLYADFSELNRSEGTLRKEEKTGFERTITKNATGESITTDKKVRYDEFSQRNSVSVILTYKLVACATGEILLSDRIVESASDEIRYAVYSGSKENLYPSDNRNGQYSINTMNYRSLQNQLRASRTITSIDKLTEKVYGAVSQKIAVQVNNFNPEK